MPAAEAHDLAVHHHDFEPQQVVGGKAVFQAMHAAGILRHVAADGTGDLAGGIGRVIEAAIGNRVRDGEIGNARLYDRAAILVIDLEDAVELAQPHQHAIGQRQRAAGERGAGAARHHLQLAPMAIAQHGGDLFGIARQDRDQRRLAIGGEAVALIGPEGGRRGDHRCRRDQACQVRRDPVPVAHRSIVDCWHGQHDRLGASPWSPV